MSDTIKCYKVVKKNSLESAIGQILSHLSVTYKVGEFVKAKVNCLFVFDSLENAQSFLSNKLGWQAHDIYEAEGRGVVEKVLFIRPICDDIVRFFKLKRNKKKCSHLLSAFNIPRGTTGVKEVKLIKKIKGISDYL